MKLLIDKEVDLNQTDLLDTKVYTNTLKTLIQNSPGGESLTIGLFGPWGSGKSSIIRTLKTEIGTVPETYMQDPGKPKTVKTPVKNSRVAFVVYDAWKYANDSFRRTFILTLQESLGVQETLGMKNFYQSTTEETGIMMKPNTPFLILVAFALTMVGLRLTLNEGWRSEITLTVVVAFMSYTTVVFSKTYMELKRSVQNPVLSAPELFERCFNEVIKTALQPVHIPGNCFKKEVYTEALFDKIVIVVDNIDRCSKETAYELLTNTKNFISSKYEVIFLLPMDEEALKTHLFKSDPSTADHGEEFLRKYFNVVVRMKTFRHTEIFDFSNRINEEQEMGLKRDTVNIIAREYARNPRRIIQFYNNLAAELRMMTLKHQAKFVKTHEAAICKFLIIREEWPEQYKSICANPKAFLELDPGNHIAAKDGAFIAPESYEAFLDSTYVSTRNLKFDELQKILLNSDNYSNFPVSIAKAAASGSLKAIKEALETENLTKEKVLDHLLFSLKSAIEKELYDTDVSDLMDQFMGFLLAQQGTDKTYIGRLESTTARKLHKIIPSSRSFKRLAQFNQLAYKRNKLDFLDMGISAYFDGFKVIENKEYTDTDFELYHNYLLVADQAQTGSAAGFFSWFLKSRNWEDRIMSDIKPGQFNILYDEGVLSEIFFDSGVPVWLDQNYDHWVTLLKTLEEPGVFIKLLMGNAGQNLDSYTGNADLFVSKYGILLNMMPSANHAPEEVDRLHLINDHLFVRKPGNPSFMDTMPAESMDKVFAYLLESFRFTGGSESSAGWITEFIRIVTLPPYARILSSFVKEYKGTLDFSELKALVLLFPHIDSNTHELHKEMLYLNPNGKDLFSDAEIIRVLNELIEGLNGYPDYAKFLKEHTKRTRSKKLLQIQVNLMTQQEFDQQPEAFRTILGSFRSSGEV